MKNIIDYIIINPNEVISQQTWLGNNSSIVSKKSFTAYILPILIWFVVFIFVIAIYDVVNGFISVLLGFSVMILLVYIMLYIRSYTLFMNDKGLWVFRGVLPWNAGFYGVKWIDFDEATFEQNFYSWALNSYDIQAKNKYKQQNEQEIQLTQMYNGDKAVAKINKLFLQNMS